MTKKWTKEKSAYALGTLRKYGRPHSKWLAYGTFFAFAVVFFRLALPWPLRWIFESIIDPDNVPAFLTSSLPEVDFSIGSVAFYLIVLYVLLALLSGISELYQRVNMRRYSIKLSRDLRHDSVKSVLSPEFKSASKPSSDVVASVIGDSARVGSSLNGILVNFSRNFLLYAGICIIFFIIAPMLGLFFLVGGVLSMWLSVLTVESVAEKTGKQRGKEETLASSMQQVLESSTPDTILKNIEKSSEKAEVKTTRLISISSIYVHGVLAISVGAGLWYGVNEISKGTLEPGVLFLFIVYAVTAHRRVVQIGRQVARSGKVLANVGRLGALIENVNTKSSGTEIKPLANSVNVNGVTLLPYEGRKRRKRLKEVSLEIKQGSKVLVLGGPGDGKSSFMRILTGREEPSEGKVYWDGIDLSKAGESLYKECVFISQDGAFEPVRVWQLLGLPDGDNVDSHREEVLDNLGVSRVLASLPKGLNTKVGSSELSRNEVRTLRAASAAFSSASVVVLDSATEGITGASASKRVGVFIDKAIKNGTTLLMSMSRAIDAERFDRIIVLRKGKIRFDGTYGEWKDWKELKETKDDEEVE